MHIKDTFKINVSVLPFQGELLNPCRCDGSVRYTHQLCLLKWISERGSWTCELCCYRYNVIAIKMKKPCQVICLLKKICLYILKTKWYLCLCQWFWKIWWKSLYALPVSTCTHLKLVFKISYILKHVVI